MLSYNPERTMVRPPNRKRSDYIACPMLGSRKPKGIGINILLAMASAQLQNLMPKRKLGRVNGVNIYPAKSFT